MLPKLRICSDNKKLDNSYNTVILAQFRCLTLVEIMFEYLKEKTMHIASLYAYPLLEDAGPYSSPGI